LRASSPVRPRISRRAMSDLYSSLTILTWRALKILAVEQEATLNALAVEAFNDLLKKHGKRANVENPLLD
jgi:hypothetical protein